MAGVKSRPPPPLPVQLGDAIHEALTRAGITDERVARWVGRECGGCRRRQEKLNALGQWAARVLRGRLDRAAEYLDDLLGED